MKRSSPVLCIATALVVLLACSEKQAPHSGPPAEPSVKLKKGDLPPELSRYRSALEAARLAYIRITTKKDDDTPWSSRFGGTPYFPKGMLYPMNADGTPMALIAQINFGEMPNLDGYPSTGLLQFFISGGDTGKQVWGSLQYDEKPFDPERYFQSLQDQRYFRVLYHPNIIMDVAQMDDPPDPPADEFLPISGHVGLSFEKRSGYVDIFDYRFARVFGKDPTDFFPQFGAKEADVANGYIAFSSDRYLAKVGGYASFVQDDPRKIRPDEDWLVLLEIQSSAPEDGINILWGDAGVGGLFIRRKDLARRDFSKVAYYWDNH